MRIIIALAVLVLSLCLGGCSRAPVAVIFGDLPKPIKAPEVEAQLSTRPNSSIYLITAETKAAAATMTQEAPKDIVASQIRSQGYACDSPQNAERDVASSKAHEAVWMLDCQNASYRVTVVPNRAAKVDKLDDKSLKPASSAL
jgi:hypothetical protein